MALITDTSRPFGSEVVTINSVTYKADDFELTTPTEGVDSLDEFGEVNGATYIPKKITGTATLQLATSGTALPTIGGVTGTFTRSAISYLITEVGLPETNGDYRKVRISFAKKYN